MNATRRTILIVDDEAMVLSFLTQLFSKNSWTVSSASSTSQAIAMLDIANVDAVLCDLDLGKHGNGMEVLTRLREMNSETPFVLLTAHGSTGRCREAFTAGAADFIEKPSSPNELLSVLNRFAPSEHDALSSNCASLEFLIPPDRTGSRHIRRAFNVVERRYSDADFDVSELAASVGISPAHLARLFTSAIGRTPLDCIHEVRVVASVRLLATPSLSIYEIARDVGYNNSSDYDRWFRKLRGTTPSEFRQRRRQ